MVDTRFSVSIHIMLNLAYHQDELMNSENIAKSLKTNGTFVRKLVAKLVDAGLIQSFRGKGGGIKLAKDPKEITLKEVYCASLAEKPLVSIHNKPVVKACPVSCSVNDILCSVVSGIENSTKNYLGKIYLSDLIKKIS